MNGVTFIIPTMGRQTLERAVSSVALQTRDDWKVIVVYDGRYDINYSTPNPKIQIIKADVVGHAGLIRNYGIEMVNTEWTAFLDDDDWVEPKYVERLAEKADTQPHMDIIIFSYQDVNTGNIQPRKNVNKIKECGVGISFAIKTSFVKEHNIRFTPYAIEDFRFLDDSVKAGARYDITHEILYKVGGIGGWVRKD